jgi:hypothetical protein
MSGFAPLASLDPGCWCYLAEGFDSMLFSYSGPPDPLLTSRALRLFKIQHEGFRRAGAAPLSDFAPYVALHQRFLALFVRPHLHAIDSGTPVAVTPEFVEQMQAISEPLRSARRVSQSNLCLTSTVGILHWNHILPGSLVVEIKPKWGFLPDCPLIANPVKLSVSRFQLLQRLKLRKGEIASFSEYYPPDLFSRADPGVTKALDALLANPQGNLKVFRDRQPSTLDTSEKVVLARHFLSPGGSLFETMKQLLALQKLDFWDIENIEPVLNAAGHPSWDDLVQDKGVVVGVARLVAHGFRLPSDAAEARQLLEQMDRETARIHLAGFLVSLSAKDCSLMIVFPKSVADAPECFVIDFDLKKPELLLSNYLKADRQIVEAYLEWKAAQRTS